MPTGSPLTNLSNMLMCQLFALDSGMHHLGNIVLHALAALLLFAALNRATRALWPSAFVAFVFAMHPLHVESVAWISERKDVLSAFFWFLALYAYVRYAERPTLRLYLMTAAAFALGLMAKPMLVTFPFTLLLLDVWPLRRSRFPRTLWEKLPLFALSIASSIVTFFVQRAGGAIRTFPLSLRLENALISYAAYLGQTFWPSHLAVFYPYPLSPAPWQAVAALLVVAGISLLALLTLRTRPYLAVGWLWYLGTLVPVIGLVQVGSQSRADRYTYIPMTGIAIMLAWGAADAARKWPRVRNAVAWAGVVMSLACVVLTWRQTGYWKNSEELFQHSIDVTENNAVAELNLGSYLMSVPGRGADAVAHLQAALRIDPDTPWRTATSEPCLRTSPDVSTKPSLSFARPCGSIPASLSCTTIWPMPWQLCLPGCPKPFANTRPRCVSTPTTPIRISISAARWRRSPEAPPGPWPNSGRPCGSIRSMPGHGRR